MSDQLNVPVDVRSHEVKQLRDMVPQAADDIRAVTDECDALAEDAEELDRIYEEYITQDKRRVYSGTPYLSMPADDWRLALRHLKRVEDVEGKSRVWWLRKKLTSRLRDRLEEMEDDDGDGQ